MKAWLVDAEEAAWQQKRAAAEATWGAALTATQTASGVLTGCV